MKARAFSTVLALAALLAASRVQAQGAVSGYVFGDYFYKATGDSTGAGSQYSALRKVDHAFQFRRLYLYYDHPIGSKFVAQFLLEGNDKTFEPGGRHGVFVKTAYLQWKTVFPLANIWIGMVPTPTWSSSFSEKTWNYRSIEKTITDFRGLGSASDIGLLLQGKLHSEDKAGYLFMVGNGRGQKPEDNRYKKFYGTLYGRPAEGLLLEAYGDFEEAKGGKDKTTLKGFAAYKHDRVTAGVEAVQQVQKAGAGGKDKKPRGIAVFVWAPLPGAPKFNAFVRFDTWNPDTENSTTGFTENFFVAGIDHMPVKNVHIMPNVWVNTFSNKDDSGAERDADVVARVTVHYVYK